MPDGLHRFFTMYIRYATHVNAYFNLAANPFLSLAYIADPFKPIYVECRAVWDGDLATRQRIWDLFRRSPPPLGFDPALTWGAIESPENGLLRLTPWRIELNDYSPPPQTKVWRMV